MEKLDIKIGLKYFINCGNNLLKRISDVETVYEYDRLIIDYNNFFMPAYYLLGKIINVGDLNLFKFNDNLGNKNIQDIANVVSRRRNLTFLEDTELIKQNLLNQVNILENAESKIMQGRYITSSEMKNVDDSYIYSKIIDVISEDYLKIFSEIEPLVNYRVPGNSEESNNNLKRSDVVMKKIFISHSSKDASLVEDFITLIELIGVDTNKIFCSSVEGYGIKLGENFLEVLKKELDDDILVIFILSNNFYYSPICLCEMGATWIRTNYHIPILIPPLTFDQVKGVLYLTQGLTITDKYKLNSLKSELEKIFNLTPIENNKWERNRDKMINRISQYISVEST